VTHADLRRRLRAYADGTLDESQAEIVRVHLATGCPECLREVFTRPVGLPRPATPDRRRWRPGVVMGALVAAVVGVLVGALVGTPRERETADPAIARLTTEVEGLKAEVERLRAELDQAGRTQATEGGRGEGDAEPAGPGAEPPDAADAVPAWLHDLLAAPGARVLPLAATADAPGASGFALWSPSLGVVVLSGANLPLEPALAVYRVRVTLSDDSTVWVGDVEAGGRATLIMTVAMPEPGGRRVTGVDLYRDPPGTPILTGRLA
jgi:hypothetical protein